MCCVVSSFLPFSFPLLRFLPLTHSTRTTDFTFRGQYTTVPLHSPANSFLFRPHCFVCFESLPGKRRRLFCTDNDRRVSGIQLLSHDSASKRHQLCASSLLPSASFVLLVGALGPRVALLGPPSRPCRSPSQEPTKTQAICSLQHNTMGSRPSSVVALFYYCGGCVVL